MTRYTCVHMICVHVMCVYSSTLMLPISFYSHPLSGTGRIYLLINRRANTRRQLNKLQQLWSYGILFKGFSLSNMQVKQCNGCHRMSYCPRDCQRNDWSNGYKMSCIMVVTDCRSVSPSTILLQTRVGRLASCLRCRFSVYPHMQVLQ